MSSHRELNDAHDKLVAHGYVVMPRYSITTAEALAEAIHLLLQRDSQWELTQEPDGVQIFLPGIALEEN